MTLLLLLFSSVHIGRGTIFAVDLLPIVSIPGVHIICGDFLHDSTTAKIRNLLVALKKDVVGHPDGKADVILSDMAANSTGNTAHDIQCSLDICEAVFEFARVNLRSAGVIGRKNGGVLLYVHLFFCRFHLSAERYLQREILCSSFVGSIPEKQFGTEFSSCSIYQA